MSSLHADCLHVRPLWSAPLLCAAVAPAGSYLDKGVGKKCPKGTYTEGLNTLSVCNACATGVTTAGEGSTSRTDCNRAIKGYKYTGLDAVTGSGTAAKCDINTYNDVETTSSTCTDCPNGECGCWSLPSQLDLEHSPLLLG